MSKQSKDKKSKGKPTNSGVNEHPSIEINADPLSQFHLEEDGLRLELVKAQYALRETQEVGQPTGLLVIVDGMEMSGKGAAVTQLRQWVDPRLLNVESTLGHTPGELEPVWQTHVENLPSHGDVTIYFGNWYADVIHGVLEIIAQHKSSQNHASNNDNNDETTNIERQVWVDYLKRKLDILSTFEKDLVANHTKVLKCWFHIDDETLKARLKDERADPIWLYHMNWRDEHEVAVFNQVAKELLAYQDDWIIIDGSNTGKTSKSYSEKASMTFCHEVLHAMQQALLSSQKQDSWSPCNHNRNSASPSSGFSWVDVPDELVDINDPDMDKSNYKKALKEKQAILAGLLRDRGRADKKYESGKGHHVVFAFEGMDAAGKGGAIKRLVSPLDPREYKIHNIGAPMPYELMHPYLWRFWTKLPTYKNSLDEEDLSRIVIFDRTWYGRVLVERIEGFASEKAWQRAYDEINRMEYDLAQKGTIILKYWLAIDKNEQLKRFIAREETPHKKYKLTEDDWRNRNKWEDYVQAAADMLARTNTKYAPWHVVATNDKRTARLAVLDHAIKQLKNSQ